MSTKIDLRASNIIIPAQIFLKKFLCNHRAPYLPNLRILFP